MAHPFKHHTHRIVVLRRVEYLCITIIWFDDIVQSSNVLTGCNGRGFITFAFALKACLLWSQYILQHYACISSYFKPSNALSDPYKSVFMKGLVINCALKTVEDFNASTSRYVPFCHLWTCPTLKAISSAIAFFLVSAMFVLYTRRWEFAPGVTEIRRGTMRYHQYSRTKPRRNSSNSEI
jgi:hypothetical protein